MAPHTKNFAPVIAFAVMILLAVIFILDQVWFHLLDTTFVAKALISIGVVVPLAVVNYTSFIDEKEEVGKANIWVKLFMAALTLSGVLIIDQIWFGMLAFSSFVKLMVTLGVLTGGGLIVYLAAKSVMDDNQDKKDGYTN